MRGSPFGGGVQLRIGGRKEEKRGCGSFIPGTEDTQEGGAKCRLPSLGNVGVGYSSSYGRV